MPFKHRGPSRTLLSIALFSFALGLTGCSGSGGSDNITRGDGGFYFDRSANAWKDPSGEIWALVIVSATLLSPTATEAPRCMTETRRWSG